MFDLNRFHRGLAAARQGLNPIERPRQSSFRGHHDRPIGGSEMLPAVHLWTAVDCGDVLQTKSQLDAGVSPNTLDPLGSTSTVLMLACDKGRLDLVHLLLQYGADTNVFKRTNHDTPLMRACQSGSLELVEVLLNANALPNAARSDNGATALAKAAGRGCVDIVELLLHHSAAPNLAPEPQGWSPLMRASQSGRIACVNILLQAGAQVNQVKPLTGESALFFAAYGGHEETALRLLEHGADANMECLQQKTPISAAAQNGTLSLVKIFATASSQKHRKDARFAAEKFFRRSCADWLQQTELWSNIRIAVAVRKHNLSRTLLCKEKISSKESVHENLVETAFSRTPWGGNDTVGVDAECVSFARLVLLPWCPANAYMYAAKHRKGLSLIFLVAKHLQLKAEASDSTLITGSMVDGGVILPREIWILIASMWMGQTPKGFSE